jgi:hypothetical protein
MAIKKIKVHNFKSFKDIEVDLGNFNILIGPNASGKSNFIQIFQFLRDITNYGLDNAISIQGGVGYLRNINIGPSENFSLEVVTDREYRGLAARTKEAQIIGMKTYETIYKFAMKFRTRGPRFEIVEEKLTQKCDFVILEMQKGKIEEKESPGKGEIIFSKVNGKVDVDLTPPEGVSMKKEDVILPFLREEKSKPKTLLFGILPPLFGDISIYDFDPKLLKKATPITGKAELEEDGSNLAIVLSSYLQLWR